MWGLLASMVMCGWVISQARLKLEGAGLIGAGVFAFLLTWLLTSVAGNLGTALLRTGLLAYVIDIGSMLLVIAVLVPFFRWRIRTAKSNSHRADIAKGN